MIVGVHVFYTIHVIQRAEYPELYDTPTGKKKILSTLSIPALCSLVIWGVGFLPWYVVIIWFLVCSFMITPIMFKKIPLATIFHYKPHSEALLLLLGILIWI